MHYLSNTANYSGNAGEMRMKHPWNASWWFRPGQVEEAFLSDDWIGPSGVRSSKNKTIIGKELSQTADAKNKTED